MTDQDQQTISLHMQGIKKSFGATRALVGVDLTVRAGEVHALVGENGAGKSTLMKILSGALQSDAGTIDLEGRPYRPAGPLDARRRGVTMIYQELSLVPHLTVMENILLGIEPTRMGLIDWPRMRRIARDALARIGIYHIAVDQRVGRLSPAERQMVEIARAVAIDCRVLILDEPTSSLSKGDIEKLFALIRTLKSQGVAIVYISHFLEEVREISDITTVLRDGRSVGTARTADLELADIIRWMVGRDVDDLYPRGVHTPAEPILDVRYLSGIEKPRDVSFTLHRGEVVGIAGLVGAGRTELMRILFGLDPPDTTAPYDVRLNRTAGPRNPQAAWRRGMGYVSEDRKDEGLAVGLSVADNLTLPAMKDLCWGPILTRQSQRTACRPMIEALEIRCRSADQTVATLSGGNQQKVALARLLYSRADVLLLDEPTRGIDVGSKAEIYRLIDRLTQGSDGIRPKAILIVSSYLPELLGICDRIAVMSRGRLSPLKPVDQWDEHSLMHAATGQAESE